MNSFVLTPKNKHMSAQAILDVILIRQEMRLAKAIETRYPDSSFMERFDQSFFLLLSGTRKYNVIPKAPEGTKVLVI